MAVKYGAVKSFTTKESTIKESTIPAVAVDLGIVMTRPDGTTYKLYWAQSNLGENGLCANPEDYGDYYAWGETETKWNYSWSTYKFCTSGYNRDNAKFSKYNTSSSYGPVDNKRILDPEDDVAHVKLGGNWRMPTVEEWRELMTKCTWTWVKNYNGTGINGRLVTATNGNNIFLPAAGYRYGSSLYNAGSYGSYWSSSLPVGGPYDALYVEFDSRSFYWSGYDRFYGLSVRPVSE